MRRVGFSTGAIALGDFQTALDLLAPCNLPCIELSALRVSEVQPLLGAISNLALGCYQYVSFHAPSRFSREEEVWLSEQLKVGVPRTWPIVLHPDAIYDFERWRPFGNRLAVENMDRRKSCGRNTVELLAIFERLPEAGMCFDIGHSRQYDPSMTEAFSILKTFASRIVQVHLSDVNSESQHEALSYGGQLAFSQVADLIGVDVPIIVESRVEASEIATEVGKVERALPSVRNAFCSLQISA